MATESPKPEETPASPAPASHGGEVQSPPAWELLFEEHKATIFVAVPLLVVALFVAIIIQHRGEARRTEAGMAFSSASSIAEYEAVSRDHSGTTAGGNALLMKADLERRENKVKESQATLTSFVTAYEDHPLYYKGLLALAALAHERGALDEAENYFQQVIDASDSADFAPLAVIRKGDIAYEKGNYEAARSLYQSVAPTYPGSPFSYKAQQKLRREKLLPPKPKPEPAPAPALPSALLPPAATPAPAPATAPAPVKPSADSGKPAPAKANAEAKPAAKPAATPPTQAPKAPATPAPEKSGAKPSPAPATPVPASPPPAAPKGN